MDQAHCVHILYSSDTLEQKADDAWSVTARHAATPTMCSVRVPHLPVGSKTAEKAHAVIIARNYQCIDLELVCVISTEPLTGVCDEGSRGCREAECFSSQKRLCACVHC